MPTLDLLPTVVLKVAHHGSGTSSDDEFIQHVRPKVALIGVGRANPYGHPVPTRARATRVRSVPEVFRTDLDGQVRCRRMGSDVRVSDVHGPYLETQGCHEGHEGTKGDETQ